MHPGTTLTDAIRLWPTPVVPDGGRSLPEEIVDARGTSPDGSKRQVVLETMVRYWPTPKAAQYGSSQNGINKDRPSAGTPSLETMASRGIGAWATPRSRDWKGGGKDCIDRQAQSWPTPRASSTTGQCDHGEGSPDLQTTALRWRTPQALSSDDSRMAGQCKLDLQAKLWPTPRASESEQRTHKHQPSVANDGHGRTLAAEAETFPPSLPGQETSTDGAACSDPIPTSPPPSQSPDAPAEKKQLNAMFVEWLQGLPPGWTDPDTASTAFEPAETWLARNRSLLRSLLSR